MLKELRLTHFKCFEELALPLCDMTLLSGANASGKSTIIQSLVLLHQTIREHERSNRLYLNGSALQLGTLQDVVDQVNGRREFSVGLTDEDASVDWRFSAAERTDMSLPVKSVTLNGAAVEAPDTLRYLHPVSSDREAVPMPARRLLRLNYITAERVGPRDVYSLEDGDVETSVGRSGERAASVLHCGRDERVLDGLALDGAPPTRLHQVEARMRQFFPGCSFIIGPVARMNAVTLGLRTSDDTGFHRPVNIGFGLTQVFPILVAALSSAKGDILLIENPEVHLHPGGQALMGRFLAEVADAGVQVILETHSDHVLNGIRRAVKAGMNRDKVALHFFRPPFWQQRAGHQPATGSRRQHRRLAGGLLRPIR